MKEWQESTRKIGKYKAIEATYTPYKCGEADRHVILASKYGLICENNEKTYLCLALGRTTQCRVENELIRAGLRQTVEENKGEEKRYIFPKELLDVIVAVMKISSRTATQIAAAEAF